jgi:hypothetical protein
MQSSKHFRKPALAALLVAFIGLVYAWLPRPGEAAKSAPPTLNGAAAINQLKEQGAYHSLAAVMNAARRRI